MYTLYCSRLLDLQFIINQTECFLRLCDIHPCLWVQKKNVVVVLLAMLIGDKAFLKDQGTFSICAVTIRILYTRGVKLVAIEEGIFLCPPLTL